MLILDNTGSGLSKAEFFYPAELRDSWLNKCRSGSLCFSKFSLGLLVQGHAQDPAQACKQYIPPSLTRVAKPNSKCWPTLCLGLGEHGSGTGCGGMCCCSPSQLTGWHVILDWSVCRGGVLCLLANQGALCCCIWGLVLEVSLDTSGLSQVGRCLSGKGTKPHSTFVLRGKQSVPISAEQG